MISYIDLSGEWRVTLDKTCGGGLPKDYEYSITLPNSTSNAQLGEENTERESGYLTDLYRFEGDAWFTRKADLSAAAGKSAKLLLERTRLTKVYIDGRLVGEGDSLTTPHVFDISGFVGKGMQEITICVSNVGYPTAGGHMTSKDTQSNWNGITGKIGVKVYGAAHASDVTVTPLVDEKAFRVHAVIAGKESGKATVSALSINAPDGKAAHTPEAVVVNYTGGELLCTLPLGDDARFWDEYSPELYRITVTIDGDETSVTAGLREFKASGDKFYINGRKTFLRGKHDGMIFPLTGFAPTDVDGWLRVMKIAKSYGMNHYRFHTCCPPEAAFDAADILGIYMEPQLPFWGTIHAPDEEGFNEKEQEYLIAEGFRILREFGNHPSFCMMSMGNELWGSQDRINEIMAGYKAVDGRHLYTQGSNNFQWFPCALENDDFFVGVRLSRERLIRGSYAMCDAPLGHIQTDKPSTRHCYDGIIRPQKTAQSNDADGSGTVQIQYGTTMKTVRATEAEDNFIPEIPIVTHEIGQFETFPNFEEIKKYTGALRPRNFEIFRDRMEKRGLLPLSQDIFKASGALAVQCYKEEMEAVFRSELLAGFQILDIQDFSGQGTALVGVLDAFMDEKGICSPEEWREFCNDVVLLARFDSYTLSANENVTADIELVSYRPFGICGGRVTAAVITECGRELARAEFDIPKTKADENYFSLGSIEFTVPDVKQVRRITLRLSIDDTDIKNHYDFKAFPAAADAKLGAEYIFSEENDKARAMMESGAAVLIAPDIHDPEFEKRSVEGFWAQDFWCYPMFASISDMMEKPRPVGTMGLLIDTEHPALAEFASEKYSTPQWWEIVQNSRSEVIDGCAEDKRVIVRTIDNFDRCHDLALMYEYDRGKGKAVVLNADLGKLSQSPEGRQFIKSVTDYVKNCNSVN